MGVNQGGDKKGVYIAFSLRLPILAIRFYYVEAYTILRLTTLWKAEGLRLEQVCKRVMCAERGHERGPSLFAKARLGGM